MTAIQIRLWDEPVPLDQALAKLMPSGMADSVLKELVKKLFLQRCFEQYKLNALQQDTVLHQTLLEQFYKQLNLPTPAAVETFLKRTAQTQEGVLKNLVETEQLNRLKQIVISDEAVQEAFLQRKPQLDTIVFQLIRVGDEALAQELYYRLTDDHESFDALVSAYSTGPEAQQMGIIGPKPLSMLNPELRKMIQTLQPGMVSEPFSLSPGTLMLAKCLRLDSVSLSPQLARTIRQECFETWLAGQLRLANPMFMYEPALPEPASQDEAFVA